MQNHIDQKDNMYIICEKITFNEFYMQNICNVESYYEYFAYDERINGCLCSKSFFLKQVNISTEDQDLFVK